MIPLVTCVMLTRWPQRGGMVRDALASFHAQTLEPRELLVINEGAPLTSDVDGVRVINTGARVSLGLQRNIGLQHARGEWVAVWDDDDASLPTRLEAELDLALRAGADCVWMNDVWLADETLAPRCRVSIAGHATALWRRAAALAVGGYPSVDYAEDETLRARALLVGRPCAVLPEALYLYRRHDTNISGVRARESLERWARACHGVDQRAEVAAQLARMRADYPGGYLRSL